MCHLQVKAKNLKITEEHVGKAFDEIENPVFFWSPLYLKVTEIDRWWGIDPQTSAILLYSGELILVKEYHKNLAKKIKVLEDEMKDQEIPEPSTTEDEEEMEENEE